MIEMPGPREPLTLAELLSLLDYDAVELVDLAATVGSREGATVEEVRDFVLGSLEPALRQGLIRPMHLFLRKDDPPLDDLSVEEVLRLVVDDLVGIEDPERSFEVNLWFVKTPAGNSLRQETAAGAQPVTRKPGAALAAAPGPASSPAQREPREPLTPLELLSMIGNDAIELVDLAALPGLFEGSPAQDVRDFVIGSLGPALRGGLVRPAHVRSLTRDGELHGLAVDGVLGLVVESLVGLDEPGRSTEVDLWFFPTPAGVSMRRAHETRDPADT